MILFGVVVFGCVWFLFFPPLWLNAASCCSSDILLMYLFDWVGVEGFIISRGFLFRCFIIQVWQCIPLAFSSLFSVPKHGVSVLFFNPAMLIT